MINFTVNITRNKNIQHTINIWCAGYCIYARKQQSHISYNGLHYVSIDLKQRKIVA